MSDMVKIGFTQRLPEDRAEELFSTSVPFPFEVTYRASTMRPHEVEQAVHRLLDVQRVTPGREFFRVGQAMAEEVIRFCQERVTGIDSWESMPVVHRLRAGDRLVLPLRAGQTFVVTAYPSLMAPSAEVVGIWQAYADDEVLELHVTNDSGLVRGLSDGDDGAEEDPLPYLNREGSAPNGHLIGRERLMAGDRLSWLSDHPHVVFEMHGFCQVFCRTWDPRAGGCEDRPFTLAQRSCVAGESTPPSVSGTCLVWTFRGHGRHEILILRTAGRPLPSARASRRIGCTSYASRNDRELTRWCL